MATQAGVVGVDLGSSKAVVAVAKRGNVEVVVNEANYRQTPCLITYGDERAVGDAAKDHVKKELRNSVHMPVRFLGELTPADLERECFFNYAAVRHAPDGRVFFDVRSGGATLELSAEQALGALFTKVAQILALNQFGCTTLVVAVPVSFGPVERQAVVDAARIAGLEVSLLVNEASAVLLAYGIFRKAELQREKGRVVLFADVGHSKTSVFAARFLGDSAEVLYERTDCALGVRDLDQALFAFYAAEVMQRWGRSVADFPKAKLRLLDAVERQRKVLSANGEARLSVDCLIGDLDFAHSLTREQYCEVCAPVFDRLQQFFLLAREELGELGREAHSVEKVGGGSRIPMVEKILAVAFGVEAVSKTLDAGESVARGAAIRAAMISPMFKVADFAIKDRLGADLRARFRYDSDPAAKDAVLFARGAEAGKVLSVGLSKNERLSFQVYLPRAGGERLLLAGEVERADPRSDRAEAKLFFTLDSGLFVRADRAEIKETFAVESGAEEPGARRERTETRPLALTVACHYGLAPAALAAARELEQQFVAHEGARLERQNTKYALEAFIYDTRGDLESEAQARLLLPEERPRMLAALAEGQSWLENEGGEAAADALRLKADALRKACDSFLARRERLSSLSDFVVESTGRAQRLSDGFGLAGAARPELQAAFEAGLQGLKESLGALQRALDAQSAAQIDAFNTEEHRGRAAECLKEAEKATKQVERERAEEQRKKPEPPQEEPAAPMPEDPPADAPR